VDECNDRIVAMKPDDCSIGFFASVMVDTPIGGGAPAPAGGPPPRVHAEARIARDPMATERCREGLFWKDIAPEG